MQDVAAEVKVMLSKHSQSNYLILPIARETLLELDEKGASHDLWESLVSSIIIILIHFIRDYLYLTLHTLVQQILNYFLFSQY